MSHEAVTLVKSRAFGSVSAKAVALVLADYCDAEWSCYVGQERLAWEAEVGARTVRRILQNLEGDGLITRKARYKAGHRTSDRIFLCPQAIQSLPARLAALSEVKAANERFIPATGDIHTGQSLAGESLVSEPLDKNRGGVCIGCEGTRRTVDDDGFVAPCPICSKRVSA